jgi:hypothetical protein
MKAFIDVGLECETHIIVRKNGTGELQTAPPAKNKWRIHRLIAHGYSKQELVRMSVFLPL